MHDPEIDWREHFPDIDEREEVARLIDAVDEARRAVADHPLTTIRGADGKPLRCEKSGMVILDTDEIVEDVETGEVWIRSAIGLPPRAIIEDDEEPEEPDESEFEDAA